jgi:hypothetical protein
MVNVCSLKDAFFKSVIIDFGRCVFDVFLKEGFVVRYQKTASLCSMLCLQRSFEVPFDWPVAFL